MSLRIAPDTTQIPVSSAPTATPQRTASHATDAHHAQSEATFLAAAVDAVLQFSAPETPHVVAMQVPLASSHLKSTAGNITQHMQRVPEVPAEIAAMVLQAANLNPMQLMALMTSKDSSGAPTIWSEIAHDNAFWATFVQRGDAVQKVAEGAYAAAFVRRYEAMTAAQQTMLSKAWSALNIFESIELKDSFSTAQAKSNFDIMRAAVSQRGSLLGVAHADLQANPDIVRAAVSQDGLALRFAHMSLRSDVDIVRAAVSQDGLALRFAHMDLRSDVGIVRAAVSQDGEALQCAHPDLQANPHIVRAAVSQDGVALVWAHVDLRRDPDIVRTAVSQDGVALAWAHADLRRDPDIVRAAVSQDGVALQFAHPDLQANPDIVRAAVSQNGLALKLAHVNLRSDPDIVRVAVCQNGSALSLADAILQSHPEFQMLARNTSWSR